MKDNYLEYIRNEIITTETKEFSKGYKAAELRKMRAFYVLIQKCGALHRTLSWNHYLKLLPLNEINELNYYINITIRDNLSYRNLSLRIKSDEYHRLSPVTRDKLETNKKIKSGEEVLNPIIIKR